MGESVITRLPEIKWEGGKGLMELNAWGLDFCLGLARMLEDAEGQDLPVSEVSILARMLLERLEDSKAALFRMHQEMKAEGQGEALQ